eukprot:TRINITY_DN6480_c0_g1_i1.p1 TRINITY_DN6480_c0_g1~~TRINITY_DN6480_c0_g1_i1.p1  ORF type:complete len:210 (+),score=35.91 TRINITY_DN6480_c0_g1_i1:72-701(+)
MNILPHKSWHIWNKDNLEKIAKDEAENAAKEAQELKRKQSVELEARVEELKRRRRSDNVTDVGNSDIRTKQESESSDLLHELLDGPKEKRHLDFLLPPVNEEAEAEKQEAKMKEMKKFTSYLGDGSIETSRKLLTIIFCFTDLLLNDLFHCRGQPWLSCIVSSFVKIHYMVFLSQLFYTFMIWSFILLNCSPHYELNDNVFFFEMMHSM